jgi:uncharacterized protein (TIGR00255 family)
MIKSMTGYASESFFVETTKYIVEAKSVNSKILDLKIRLPQFLKNKEFEIRKLVSKELVRGKIELNVNQENKQGSQKVFINSSAVLEYIKELKTIDGDTKNDYLGIAMQLPSAYDYDISNLSDEQINSIEKTIEITIKKLNDYRLKEGSETKKDLLLKISSINSILEEVEKIENLRIDRKRQKLQNEFDKLNIEFDKSRLEQEMIYYIEKFDLNEELVRLKSHIKLFTETINSNVPVGKKLGFICQEIGREINTLGSKSNDSDLQKFVIEMKDSLEKIKENILNIL